MSLTTIRWHSIKTRVTLCTLAVIIVSTLALAIYGRGILHRSVKGLLSEQQLATASIIAASVNQALDERRQVLTAAASAFERLDPASLANASALRARLEQQPAWTAQFNAGTLIVRSDGAATLAHPPSPEYPSARFADWDFIANALRDGKATLGQPPAGGTPPASLVGLAAPLHDAQGRIVAALVGLTDLATAGLLDQFTDSTLGRSGGYLLVSTQRRAVITGSERSGIVETLATPGISPLLDSFFAGGEGSGVAVTSAGVEVLASAKAIPVAGWYALVTLPLDDALAPFRAARKQMALAMIVLALLASTAIWLILRREFAPMLAAIKTLATLTRSQRAPPPLAVSGHDEIAELIAGFNRLLATLAQREDALIAAKTELRIAATAFDSHESMVVTDANGVILRVNKAFTESTGYPADEAIGQTPRLLKSDRHDSEFYRAMWDTINRTGGWRGEVWDRRKNGETYPKWLTISALKDNDGVVTHYVGAHFDITERKQDEARVHQLAFYDPLTKLPNRRLFNDRLNQTMAAGKRHACHGALMFIDLDKFKSLNDTHGHLAGDLLLIEVANRLKHGMREVDTVARFGGDEFVVLLGDLHADTSESTSLTANVAEKIRTALSAPYHLKLKHKGRPATLIEHRCSASIGVVLLINDGASPDELLKWADAAMYRAKATGRDSICFHDPAGSSMTTLDRLPRDEPAAPRVDSDQQQALPTNRASGTFETF